MNICMYEMYVTYMKLFPQLNTYTEGLKSSQETLNFVVLFLTEEHAYIYVCALHT